MNALKNLLKNISESCISVCPIIVIILLIFLLQFSPLFPSSLIDNNLLITFLISMIFLALGMSLFSLGSEKGLTKVGQYIGNSITRKKSIVLIIVVSFLIGLMITLAEPDLTVLSELVGKSNLINPWIFRLVVGIGVGLFLVIGLLRIVFQKSLKLWIIFFYLIIFAIACFFGKDGQVIFEISFDSSGVTTGPLTVPFLLTFGAGVASVRGGKNSSSDSFGVTGLCSIGPIVMSLLLFLPLQNSDVLNNFSNSIETSPNLIKVLSSISLEVLIAISPLLVFFLIYQAIFIKLSLKEVVKILLGFLYTYVGLTVFLVAANIGLIPIGYSLGLNLADGGREFFYLLVVIAVVIGLSIVLVEPSVHVLVSQVEEISGRSISKKSILLSLCVGVALAIVLAVIRITYGNNFNIMYLYVPLFLLALGLTFFVPDIYAAIAFDSGGVASGTMASCFVLPFIIGIGQSHNTVDSVTGFGVIGLIAVMPIITIQLLGIYSAIKTNILLYSVRKKLLKDVDDEQIISF